MRFKKIHTSVDVRYKASGYLNNHVFRLVQRLWYTLIFVISSLSAFGNTTTSLDTIVYIRKGTLLSGSFTIDTPNEASSLIYVKSGTIIGNALGFTAPIVFEKKASNPIVSTPLSRNKLLKKTPSKESSKVAVVNDPSMPIPYVNSECQFNQATVPPLLIGVLLSLFFRIGFMILARSGFNFGRYSNLVNSLFFLLKEQPRAPPH